MSFLVRTRRGPPTTKPSVRLGMLACWPCAEYRGDKDWSAANVNVKIRQMRNKRWKKKLDDDRIDNDDEDKDEEKVTVFLDENEDGTAIVVGRNMVSS